MPVFVIGLEIMGRNVLACDEKGNLTGDESLEVVKKLLPDYNGYHAAGGTWSSSAVLHWMYFQPRILEFDSLEHITENVAEMRLKSYRNISGGVTGIELKKEFKPKVVYHCPLINEGVKDAKPFYE